MKIKERVFSGTQDPSVQAYELRHRAVAREAAAEGIVLLKNEDHLLPLAPGSKIALYGAGAVSTIKGGTGSGDVNARETVSVWQGMKEAGYQIVNEDWLRAYETAYTNARLAWRQKIWDKIDAGEHLFMAYAGTAFLPPAGDPPQKNGADTAIYVVARTAGEGADRFAAPGDYELTPEEEKALAALCEIHENVVLALNVGGVVDLSVLDRLPGIKAAVLLHQAGMEAGRAFADVVSGRASPSGKLTDTWAFRYADYPNSATFSHNNGDVRQEIYTEGLYVGYRYFDAFDVPARYGFGFGLSYADFAVETLGVSCDQPDSLDAPVRVKVRVTNTSDVYSGKEVAQVYAACPQDRQAKEFRRLVGFFKTDRLAPGQSQEAEIAFPLRALTSYDEAIPGWVLEKGLYGLFVGNSLAASRIEAALRLTGRDVTEHTQHICPPEKPVEELRADPAAMAKKTEDWHRAGKPETAVDLSGIADREYAYSPAYDSVSEKARQFVNSLTEEQLVKLATGEAAKAQGASNIGSAGISVPGSAAETGACAREQGLAEIVLADGPAGLRLIKEYRVDGKITQAIPFDMAIENGFLSRVLKDAKGTSYYQYCTAIPAGTLLAQTWNPEIVAACGRAVAEEMVLFGVTLWLAPGMNIHRNPLCGRNFE